LYGRSFPAEVITRTPAPLNPAPWAPAPRSLGLEAPEISALSALVLDEASGSVLYEKDGHRLLPPASLTKIATAVVALEEGDLNDIVVSDVDSRKMTRSSVMGLRPGDQFSLRDLLHGLLLRSGNDAGLVIGRHIAGSDEAFVERMNALAERLGLWRTRFQNPHGLSARGHFSTAYDMAVLSRYAMSLPEFRETVPKTDWMANGSRTLPVRNINSFLTEYEGADGIKTGYTWSAGRTLVASAVRDGNRVYVVVLNAPERDEDAATLMDWAFRAHEWLE
jgi:serine-type D-Ala-D-Ala carboxypeptidase (penicillin-binding protein 5/6)